MYSTNNIIFLSLENISTDMIVENISKMQNNYEIIEAANDGTFQIGAIDPTLSGVLEKVPLAISTVLYRPFLWESKKFIMLLSAIENILLLLLTLYIILKTRIRIFRIINSSLIVQFCIFFTLSLAIIIGLTTFNFGTLLRYKSPLLPFFASFLILINHYSSLENNQTIKNGSSPN